MYVSMFLLLLLSSYTTMQLICHKDYKIGSELYCLKLFNNMMKMAQYRTVSLDEARFVKAIIDS